VAAVVSPPFLKLATQSQGLILLRDDAAERPVLAFVIVSPEQFLRKFPNLIDGFEQVMYGPVIANRSVVTLDISISTKDYKVSQALQKTSYDK